MSEPMTASEREPGFYWVLFNDHRWEPATYAIDMRGRGFWSILHSMAHFYDADFTAIGPRIEPPEEG